MIEKDSHGRCIMAGKSFEAAIADLEKADGRPEELLEAAAKTLGLNLQKTIERSSLEVRFRSTPQSYGFKEQWLLRWLIKKLTSAANAQAKDAGENIERYSTFQPLLRWASITDQPCSYALCPQFWSLLLNLTNSIPSNVCLDILLERKFFHLLTNLARAFRNAGQPTKIAEQGTSVHADEIPRPRKKRRLSPVEVRADTASQHGKLPWILLQAVCRCVDLFAPPSSQGNEHSIQAPLTSNLPWDEQASILGAVLETATNLLDRAAEPASHELLLELLTVVLSFWHGDSPVSQTQKDDADRAFSSHCLMPSLILLEHLRRLDSGDKSIVPPRKALERLVAIHVIFPTRLAFNQRFGRKWTNIQDALLVNQVEAMVNDLKKHMLPDKQSDEASTVNNRHSMWLILDIAARSVPLADFRRRQMEMPWMDALFMCLAHTIWPQMPRVTSPGVAQPSTGTQESHDGWAGPLEKLLDVVLERKLRLRLSVLGYILTAILALVEEIPWSLLVKIVQVDIGILVPKIGVSKSEEFLKQVVGRLRSHDVTKDIYDRVRDDLMLPLLHGFAMSRNLASFLTMWQENLANAVRVPHTSQDDETVPLVLVWEDQAVFDQFKALAQTHAPPSIGQKLLSDLIKPLSELAEGTGSRVGIFAQLALFSALLEATEDPTTVWKLDSNQLATVFEMVAAALSGESQYHGQRWRLWKLARQLLYCVGVARFSPELRVLLQPQSCFMSFGALAALPGYPSSSKILECFECFSFLLEVSTQTPDFEKDFEREMENLAHLLQLYCSTNAGTEVSLCNGPQFQCDSPTSLLAACVGALLKKPEVFSKYPDSFKRFVQISLGVLTAPRSGAVVDSAVSIMKDLLRAVLTAEEVTDTHSLRQCIVHHVLDNAKQGVTSKNDQAMLQHCLIKGVMQKSQMKTLANSTMQRLMQSPAPRALDDIAGDLALLIQLDDAVSGSVIKADDWLTWVTLSQDVTKHKQFGQSPTSLSAAESLEHVLKTLWERAVAASRQQVILDIISWCGTSIEGSTTEKQDPPFLLAIPIFLGRAVLLTRGELSTSISKKHVEKMRKSYILILSRKLGSYLRGEPDFNTLQKLRLILNAAHHIHPAELDEKIPDAAFGLVQRLQAEQSTLENSNTDPAMQLLRASVKKRCLELSMPLETLSTEVMQQMLKLAFSITDGAIRMNQQLNLLSIEAATLANHIAPAEWGSVLGRLRQHSQGANPGVFRQLLIASIITSVKDDHLQHDPKLADELADIASLDTSKEYTLIELFLALENCRMVLQLLPLTVNQPTLDRLLAFLCLIGTSSAQHDTQSARSTEGNHGPGPAEIYDKLCMVVGVILGRHRKRLNDRYHLLLPVMQKLLRCLFWPGVHGLQDRQRSVAADGLNTYAKSLPHWMRHSDQPLPPSSAEKFSRLTSSICNPTVSAARSSKAHGHNELNDATKRARQLAGQHMQYLVMEYARCTLDGQITPSVKDKLMPGMYSVLDSMDRELMRAANAGMDPSSRAIFKGLYDDWTRFGKWDKS